MKSLNFAVLAVCFLRGMFATYNKECFLYLPCVSEKQQYWDLCVGYQGVTVWKARSGVLFKSKKNLLKKLAHYDGLRIGKWGGLAYQAVLYLRGVCVFSIVRAGGFMYYPLLQALGRGAKFLFSRGAPAVAFDLASSAGYPEEVGKKGFSVKEFPLTPMTKEEARKLAAMKLKKRKKQNASKQTK